MSCSNTCVDPCVSPCESGSCYDDCGCLNPTTFECITKPGTLSAIGVTDDMNGKEVLQAINDTISDLTIDTPDPSADKYVKITSADTTSGYLNDKIQVDSSISKSVVSPSGNEKVKLKVSLPNIISADGGNTLEIGTDNKLRVIQTTPVADVVLLHGTGITITGTGPSSDPYIISTNPSISVVRSCFDGVWRDIPLLSTGTSSVVFVSGAPKYRIRWDGSIEFKGSATYTVNFGSYASSTRKFTITMGDIPSTCLLLSEQGGVSDLKSINYIDTPQAAADQIAQQYGYIIRKSTQHIILEFQSSFSSATSKTIVVNFEGAISHPNL